VCTRGKSAVTEKHREARTGARQLDNKANEGETVRFRCQGCEAEKGQEEVVIRFDTSSRRANGRSRTIYFIAVPHLEQRHHDLALIQLFFEFLFIEFNQCSLNCAAYRKLGNCPFHTSVVTYNTHHTIAYLDPFQRSKSMLKSSSETQTYFRISLESIRLTVETP
jgi:hypothetical protein